LKPVVKRSGNPARTRNEREARDALLKPAMAAFLASGGTQAEWDQQAPQIEAQIRQRAAVDAALGNDPVTREMARLLATGQYGL